MTERLSPRPSLLRETRLWYGAAIVVLTWVGIMMILNFDIFAHSPRDSYTLQALAWREGKLSLGQDYPWLELAIYEGDYYVSFPSVPALVMWLLTFFFGGKHAEHAGHGAVLPHDLLRRLCARPALPQERRRDVLRAVSDAGLQYAAVLAHRRRLESGAADVLHADHAVRARPDGKAPLEWGLGLFCLALSVGCRPFQAAFVPPALWMLYKNISRAEPAPLGRTLARMLPHLAAPAIVALALGAYNYARFGNPLEFGHNYLPVVHARSRPAAVWPAIRRRQHRQPAETSVVRGKRLMFPMFNGFAFWMVNPIYVTVPVACVVKAVRRRWDATDTLLALAVILEIFLLLLHKTLGGWQFGARYLCDPIPMMMLLELRGRKSHARWETALGTFAIAFNIYGAIVFHLMDLL